MVHNVIMWLLYYFVNYIVYSTSRRHINRVKYIIPEVIKALQRQDLTLDTLVLYTE